MSQKIIRTELAPPPVGPYNQGVAANGLLFVAGQFALDAKTGEMVGEGDVVKQTEQSFSNLKAILAEAGTSLDNVVKTTVFLANMDDFAAMNQVYGQYFKAATAPARICVEVSRLPKNALVEIECIALLNP